MKKYSGNKEKIYEASAQEVAKASLKNSLLQAIQEHVDAGLSSDEVLTILKETMSEPKMFDPSVNS
jgi:DNA-binding transcriptional regulator YhcF (GntR family)